MSKLVKELRAFAEFDRLHSHVEIKITEHICWKAAKRIEELEGRLEITDDITEKYDGIICRNETIRLLEKKIEELSEYDLKRRVSKLEAEVKTLKNELTVWRRVNKWN